MTKALVLSVLVHVAAAAVVMVVVYGRSEPTVGAPVPVEVEVVGRRSDSGTDADSTADHRSRRSESRIAEPEKHPTLPSETLKSEPPKLEVASASVSESVTISETGHSRVLSPSEYTAWVRSHNAPPDYPREANTRREEGRVVVRATVAPSGKLTAVALDHGSGFETLDRAALDAVRDWSFAPFQGERGELVLLIPFRFKLED